MWHRQAASFYTFLKPKNQSATRLIVWAVASFLAFLLAFCGLVFLPSLSDGLTTTQSTVPGSQSAKVTEILETQNPNGDIVTYVVNGLDLKNAANLKKIDALISPAVNDLKAIPGVASVVSPFDINKAPGKNKQNPLIAKDKNGFLLGVTVKNTQDLAKIKLDKLPVSLDAPAFNSRSEQVQYQVLQRLSQLTESLHKQFPSLEADAISSLQVNNELVSSAYLQLWLGLVVLLVAGYLLCLLLFTNFLTALLPVFVSLCAGAVTIGALTFISYFHTFNLLVPNLALAFAVILGLSGCAFLISRYQYEYQQVKEKSFTANASARIGDSVLRSRRQIRKRSSSPTKHFSYRATAKALFFAGHSISILSLLLLVMLFALFITTTGDITQMTLGAFIAVVISGLANLTLAPALLNLIGSKYPQILLARRKFITYNLVKKQHETWRRLILKHKLWACGVTLFVFVLCLLPIGTLHTQNVANELLQENSRTYQVLSLVSEQYPSTQGTRLPVVAESSVAKDVKPLISQVAALPQVARVSDPVALSKQKSLFYVNLKTDMAFSKQAQQTVSAIRDLKSAVKFYVGGPAAEQLDFNNYLYPRLLGTGIIGMAIGLVAYFLVSGSLVIPLLGLLLTPLTVLAAATVTSGLFTWIFPSLDEQSGLQGYALFIGVIFACAFVVDGQIYSWRRLRKYWQQAQDINAALLNSSGSWSRSLLQSVFFIILAILVCLLGNLAPLAQVLLLPAIALALNGLVIEPLLLPVIVFCLQDRIWYAPQMLQNLWQKLGGKS